jgi:hypothetical protein
VIASAIEWLAGANARALGCSDDLRGDGAPDVDEHEDLAEFGEGASA